MITDAHTLWAVSERILGHAIPQSDSPFQTYIELVELILAAEQQGRLTLPLCSPPPGTMGNPLIPGP